MTKTPGTLKRYKLTSISDDTVRYLTVQNTAYGFWFACKQVMTDGKWRTCWTSSEYPNQAGARTAIRVYLGV